MTADPQRDALERALGAQYEIVRLLGKGGMGSVYLGKERALDRQVAIKVLPSETAADPENRERFRREARTAAKLNHPNIVPLYSFGDAEGLLYFVMGYVRGESLGARIRREGRIPADEARRILGELAEALDYAHRQGVVHRDIKPDNILLDDDTGQAKLTDFGVAKAQASGETLTVAGTVIGTPHYMSPEQAAGERDIDGRSDLYSLGVMGYQMLAGRLPFEGDNVRDVIVQHVTQDPPPLTGFAPEAPPAVVGAIMRSLAKAPGARWLDGRTFQQALAAEADEEYDTARAPSRLRGGLFGVAVFAAIDAGFAWWAFHEPSLQGNDPAWWQPPAFVAIAVLAALAATAAVVKTNGHSWTSMVRAALQPPRWWTNWWPAAWREPQDVRKRLPPEIQRIRRLTDLVNITPLALSPLTIAGLVMFFRDPLSRTPGVMIMSAAVLGAAFIPLSIFLSLKAKRWGEAHGLTTEEASRFAFSATAKPEFWRKPKIAALLQSESGSTTSARRSEPQTPAEYMQFIVDASSQLPPYLREAAGEAVAGARQLLGAIASLDDELTQLTRDANPAELAQVQQKLSALGDPSGDNEPRRKMRALFDGQRELLRALAEQLSAGIARRAHYIDLLRTLWLQFASLRAGAAADARDGMEITGRIRALTAEMERHVDAAATVKLSLERT